MRRINTRDHKLGGNNSCFGAFSGGDCMKLICTASKVSWFTVGREYNNDQDWVCDNGGDEWAVGSYGNCYRTELLEDAEFSVVQEYEPITAADDASPSEQVQHEALLAAVMQMAEEEDCVSMVNYNLEFFRSYWQAAAKYPKQQRAFLLALAYFAEEKSQ